MIRRTNHRALAWAFGALGMGLLASAASASHREAVLGAGGELYMIERGTVAELFPGTTSPDAANPALALEIRRPGAAAPERVLVPGTEKAEAEGSPSLIYLDASRTLFLVWESRINPIHAVFKLAAYDGSQWFEPIDRITGIAYSPKTAPQIAVTHDSYQETGAEGPVTRHRTVLHLVWGEQVAAGQQKTLYMPIVLDGGIRLPEEPVELNRFDPATLPATAFETPADLVDAPTVQAGRDGHSVVALFASPETRRIAAVEIDVLPRELGRLADDTRAIIIDIGTRLHGSNQRAFADRVRSEVIRQGSPFFHAEVLAAIADRVQARVASSGAGEVLENLAERTRAIIIDIGVKLSGGRGIKTNRSTATSAIEEPVSETLEIAADEGQTPHFLQFHLASSRPAPRVGPGAIALFASGGGEEVLIAWPSEGKVSYRESDGNGWSDTLELRLSERFDLRRAYEVLERRVRDK